MKLGDFGIFVIFAALYAAGTLGLPQISFMGFQIRIGEIPAAFVALFGMPAIFGLTLGQFIANLGLETQPIAFLSPLFSFVGLLVIYRIRKSSILAGCIAYVVITGTWLSIMVPFTKPQLTSSDVAASVFAGQFVAVMLGYLAYRIVSRSLAGERKTTD